MNYEFKNVNFKYNQEKSDYALKNINLTIEKGSFTAIIGHNGSGKSTLAKLFNAILIPTDGKVYIDGLDVSDEKNLYKIRQKVGMVFQNPDNQIVSTIVEEDVAFGPENLGVEPEEIKQRVDFALGVVGMDEYRLHSPHMLSGGQKQRIAIASVLSMSPDCIVFDEATAMLDPQGRIEIMDTIGKLNREKGVTCVIITHYMDEAVAADRIIVMNKGGVYLDGMPHEIFSETEKIKGVGLDVPQVNELIYLLSKEDSLKNYSFPRNILHVNEAADLIEAYYK